LLRGGAGGSAGPGAARVAARPAISRGQALDRTLRRVDDLRFGSFVRAERRRRRLRQADVAVRSGLAQQTVSKVERGQCGNLTLQLIRVVCAALEVQVRLTPRSSGPEPDRLLDARHAGLVDAVVRRLGTQWAAIPEFSFAHFGERGAVDVLAWHAAARALLLVEVKTELHDLQATLRSMDVKSRVVPGLAARQRGWQARCVGSILLLPDVSSCRRAVARHAAMLAAAMPARTLEVRRWVREPSGSLRGIWFLADTPTRSAIRNPGSRGRVRGPGGGVAHAQAGAVSRRMEAPASARRVATADNTPTRRS
jgi:transcriptional regulator with XRE-family HTH domain